MALQIILYGLLAILVAAGLFLLASRFLPAGEQIAPPLRDEPAWDLPGDRPLRPEDVDSVRLPVALRGYRFAETDVLLDRLVHELRARDEEIARLRGDRVPPSPRPAPEPEPVPATEPAPLTFEKTDPAPDSEPDPPRGSWAPEADAERDG